MRQDFFKTDSPQETPAYPDLSAEIIQSIPREHNQRVTCMRVSANNYRCNWWSPAPTRLYDNPQMRGLLVTTHVVAKSRFLNVIKTDNRLVFTEVSADTGR